MVIGSSVFSSNANTFTVMAEGGFLEYLPFLVLQESSGGSERLRSGCVTVRIRAKPSSIKDNLAYGQENKVSTSNHIRYCVCLRKYVQYVMTEPHPHEKEPNHCSCLHNVQYVPGR